VRDGEGPVLVDGVAAYRIGHHVRAVRIDRSR
jgi:hypothetical protein